MTATFYKSTSSNGKFAVMSTELISGKGIKLTAINSILTHKNEIYKNLNVYNVTATALKNIQSNFNAEVANF